MLRAGLINLKKIIYDTVNVMPTIIPVTAPTLFIRLEKIPMTIAGKNELAASPKAKATT